MKKRLSSLRLIRGRQAEFLDNLESQIDLGRELETVRDNIDEILQGETNVGSDVADEIQTAKSEMEKAKQLTEEWRDGRTAPSCSETRNFEMFFKTERKGM